MDLSDSIFHYRYTIITYLSVISTDRNYWYIDPDNETRAILVGIWKGHLLILHSIGKIPKKVSPTTNVRNSVLPIKISHWNGNFVLFRATLRREAYIIMLSPISSLRQHLSFNVILYYTSIIRFIPNLRIATICRTYGIINSDLFFMVQY